MRARPRVPGPHGAAGGQCLIVPGDVADVEESDLAELHAREAVRNERVDAALRDPDVDDTATAGRTTARDRDEYRLLATMLTGVVAHDRDGEARAYDAGVRWGRHLQQAEPRTDLADLLDRQGFAAEQARPLRGAPEL